MSRTLHAVTPRTEAGTNRLALSMLPRELGAAEVLLISAMPRGGLQVVQPQRAPETLVKAYAREFHAEDRATWNAILKKQPARSTPREGYVERFLAPLGYASAVSVPVTAPVFEGYAGAVQLVRTSEQGAFSDADVTRLQDLVKDLQSSGAIGRGERAGRTAKTPARPCRRPPTRQWIFSADAQPIAFADCFGQLDQVLQDNIVEAVRDQLEKQGGENGVTSNRALLPDTDGDHWVFNIVTYASYPALGSGAVTFVCLQPSFPEWVSVRPADFQADPELARLIPALKFMQQEFRRGPTLNEIARTAHLSPFHFHRRFSELLGLTPKHFLLECQIHDAKQELLAGNKGLAKIASDCGFAHQSHFTSRFKQTTGLTPTRWRRMARQRGDAV